MPESFMTTEGDRSGVSTPDHRTKAQNVVDAAAQALINLQNDWTKSDNDRIQRQLAAIEGSLEIARRHLKKED